MGSAGARTRGESWGRVGEDRADGLDSACVLVPNYCITSIKVPTPEVRPSAASKAEQSDGLHAACTMSGLATSSPLLRQLQVLRLLAVVQLR